jgi:hypothetical protein
MVANQAGAPLSWSRLNPGRLDGDNVPPTAGMERCSQFFLMDGVRACIGTIATEALGQESRAFHCPAFPCGILTMAKAPIIAG